MKFLQTFGGGGSSTSSRSSTGGRRGIPGRATRGVTPPRPGRIERVVNAGRGFFGGAPGGGRSGIAGLRRGFNFGVRAR